MLISLSYVNIHRCTQHTQSPTGNVAGLQERLTWKNEEGRDGFERHEGDEVVREDRETRKTLSTCRNKKVELERQRERKMKEG